MADSDSWLKQTPAWVWCSLIPTFGGLSIVYAGRKTHTSAWVYLGLSICAAALALGSYPIAAGIWMLQVAVAFSLKNRFLAKMLPGHTAVNKTTQWLSSHDRLDINTCSKDEMVRRLGLPIVYANDITAIRNEGYQFTHLEELSEIAGLPESYLNKLQPLIMFAYDIRKEEFFSWRRLNTCSVPELTAFGVSEETAQAIVAERLQQGDYRSVVDVKKRTGLPFRAYQSLL
jgi:DNA uptake protein ComE-like DNA-binding protein